MTAEEYAQTYLKEEIAIIQDSDIISAIPELSIYEKAIVYKYTDDGYKDLNENLRISQGKVDTLFGKLLYESINIMPKFIGNVYRGVNLTNEEKERYNWAFINDEPITEYSFVSTSRSPLIANGFGSTRFEIFTTSGRSVESISKYSDEKEVILLCNSRFRVVKIDIDFIQLIEI